MRAVVVDHLLFRFLFCQYISELFVLKVESCQQLRQILDVFRPLKFSWGTPSKSCTDIITPVSRYVAW